LTCRCLSQSRPHFRDYRTCCRPDYDLKFTKGLAESDERVEADRINSHSKIVSLITASNQVDSAGLSLPTIVTNELYVLAGAPELATCW
jgi:hypothetical protein